jgi:regulator of protease activity HflC (stomatin/prohibitin superfamily)
MLALKYLLLFAGIGIFGGALAILIYDVYHSVELWRLHARSEGALPPSDVAPVRWKLAAKVLGLALLPLLASLSIVVVPSGSAGVRVSQIAGTRPGTLRPGVHLILPLIDRVALFDIRDRVFNTRASEYQKKDGEILRAQSKEGLAVGLAVTVRYRLDPARLDYIQANLPAQLDDEIVSPVVASVFRQLVPNYLVREVFATRREEIRQRAAEIITQRLGSDAVLVKEVMLRDIQLPVEYAKGLEQLLLKEQEGERLVYEIEIEQKRVKTAELQAEAQKVREIKRAEADAQVRVLQAKAEADAMQHTLPLKEKQIQQSRLEAEARKEATLKNAEAAAQAKVIDSKAELERRNLLAEAEANRIRVTSAADAERLKMEALVLKQNPLLIQKIIAERLSDKVQIMMVPMDGKFFFANDVLRAPQLTGTEAAPDRRPQNPGDPDDPPRQDGTAARRPGGRP